MKKFYFALLGLFFCLGTTTSRAFTLFFQIDDVKNISSMQAWYNGTSGSATLEIDLTGEMPLSVEMPDDATMRYVYIQPESGRYITCIRLLDENGNELSKKEGFYSTRQAISVPVKADFGTMEITTSEGRRDAKVNLAIEGDPSKCRVIFKTREVDGLVEGEQTLEYMSATETPMYILPSGVSLLYQVYQGTELIEPTVDFEGQYQYTIRQQDGDVVYIRTDFPDVTYPCTLTFADGTEPEAVRVLLDGEEAVMSAELSGYEFTAHAGQILQVVPDWENWTVDRFTVNGEEVALGGSSWSTLVMQEFALEVSATKVERPFHVTTKTEGWEKVDDEAEGFYGYTLVRSAGYPVVLADGEGGFDFNDADNPFTLQILADEGTEFAVYLNDAKQTAEWGTYELTFTDGDVLRIVLGKEVVDAIATAATTEAPAVWYDLSGRRVAKPGKGVYIRNGKLRIKN